MKKTRAEYMAMSKEERLAYNTGLLENKIWVGEDVARDELPTRYRNKKNGLWYQYNEELRTYDPMFALPMDEELLTTRYARARKAYLEEKKYSMFVDLLLTGKLNKHCNELSEECEAMEERLMEQMKESEGLTRELQKNDWWAYAQGIQSLRVRVQEIVMNELIYA